MQKEELINKCLKGDKNQQKFTGSAIGLHNESEFYTYCESFGPDEEKDPESLYLQMLADKGWEHELDVVKQFTPKFIDNEFEDNIQAFQFVIAEMYKGTKSLAGFPLYYLPLNYIGHIDLLRRNDSHPSIFGDYHYEVVEIKLAKNIKDKHVLQAVFYNKLLEKIQGYFSDYVYIINGVPEEIQFNYNNYLPKLEQILSEIESIRNEEKIPKPVYGDCPHPWLEYANKIAWDSRDITCISELGSDMQLKFRDIGVSTIEELASLSIERLKRIKGIGDKKATLFKKRAEALSNKTNILLRPLSLPKSNIELFIDFEGVDPTLSMIEHEAFNFLYGIIKKDNQTGEEKFTSFLIRDPFNSSEVREVTEKFMDYLLEHPDSPIYHWHHYEKTHLTKVSEKFELREKSERIKPRLIDLFYKTRASWVFPIPSMSLKYVAPHLGFKWRLESMEGRMAIAKYVEYILSPIKTDYALEPIIEYNEDDIKALIHVKNWLISNNENKILFK